MTYMHACIYVYVCLHECVSVNVSWKLGQEELGQSTGPYSDGCACSSAS